MIAKIVYCIHDTENSRLSQRCLVCKGHPATNVIKAIECATTSGLTNTTLTKSVSVRISNG